MFGERERHSAEIPAPQTFEEAQQQVSDFLQLDKRKVSDRAVDRFSTFSGVFTDRITAYLLEDNRQGKPKSELEQLSDSVFDEMQKTAGVMRASVDSKTPYYVESGNYASDLKRSNVLRQELIRTYKLTEEGASDTRPERHVDEMMFALVDENGDKFWHPEKAQKKTILSRLRRPKR